MPTPEMREAAPWKAAPDRKVEQSNTNIADDSLAHKQAARIAKAVFGLLRQRRDDRMACLWGGAMSRDIHMPLFIDDIVIGEARRTVDPSTVKRLAESIGQIGLRHPITVRERGDKYILVAGRHRLEACRKLGREHVLAVIVKMTNDEARLWEIAENLHRADLNNIDRAEHIDEWRKLTAKVAHRGTPSGGKQPKEAGIRKTAEALGVNKNTVARSAEIASIAPQAKAAALEAGVTTVRELVEVAKSHPEQQVATVHSIAKRKGKIEPRDEDEEFSAKELAARDRGSFMLRAQEAKNFAFYKGNVDDKLIEFARRTATAWSELVADMERVRR